MRLFRPQVMPDPHWHGHVEANFLTGASMTYLVEDRRIEVPSGRLILFWANIPHQLVQLTPESGGPPQLANIYLPLDVFLFMPHIAKLQVMLLSGGIVALDADLVSHAQVEVWYRDYRSGHPERREILLAELNTRLRRGMLTEPTYLLPPIANPRGARKTQSVSKAHVITMVRFIMENLSEPMSNADVASVTGLHENYALSLFTSVMRVPMRKFIIRMRLLRARALLLKSNATVSTVALQSGFPSITQFYSHFGRAFGTTPQAMRKDRT
jgi:AraC-like DNA-binding protein